MCDFSIAHGKSRPAKKGERLQTDQLSFHTHGFRAVDDTAPDGEKTAVCILPGTELAFEESVKVRGPAIRKITRLNAEGIEERVEIGRVPEANDRVATFVQIDKNIAHTHHDALEFPNGNIVMLTNLLPGQRATILSLPAQPKTAAEVEEQRRAEYV